eukprot:TRINITY_DN53879_c0_g1_i1.p1 TRINITY_DN53879_c0_g1~~TRINITY_DN53879_c0_g1_i1.p1  ORF type:complete len:267 (+),score=60.01 TRINITY_DN53879_c0_g1_i1:25-825(+)
MADVVEGQGLYRRRAPADQEDVHTEASASQDPPQVVAEHAFEPGHFAGISVPRVLLPALMIPVVVIVSGIYAYGKVEKRRRIEPARNELTRLLHLDGLHHTGLLVANLSNSFSFYASVLGGQEVEGSGSSGGKSVRHVLASEWRLMSFGTSQLLLQQQSGQAGESKLPAVALALRLGPAASGAAVHEALKVRLAKFPELAGILCRDGASESIPPPDETQLALTCSGPDGELVQFWSSSHKLTQAAAKARRHWEARASDPRGRDLFE